MSEIKFDVCWTTKLTVLYVCADLDLRDAKYRAMRSVMVSGLNYPDSKKTPCQIWAKSSIKSGPDPSTGPGPASRCTTAQKWPRSGLRISVRHAPDLAQFRFKSLICGPKYSRPGPVYWTWSGVQTLNGPKMVQVWIADQRFKSLLSDP